MCADILEDKHILEDKQLHSNSNKINSKKKKLKNCPRSTVILHERIQNDAAICEIMPAEVECLADLIEVEVEVETKILSPTDPSDALTDVSNLKAFIKQIRELFSK